MPEAKAGDYTTGELTSAANICRDAVELLTPTADELMRIAGEVELVEEELRFTRTSRHLNAAALHLKISEQTIQMIARGVRRTYDSIRKRLLGLGFAVSVAICALAVVRIVIPEHVGQYLGGFIQYGLGVSSGIFVSREIISSRIRRQPRDP